MNFRQLLIIPPIVIGVALFVWMTDKGDSDGGALSLEVAVAVRAQSVTAQPFLPHAVGFGRVEAANSWSAISQVEGRALSVNKALRVGRVVAEATSLIQIDPRSYEIALAKAVAARDGAQASLDELLTTGSNTQSTLELERRIEAFLQTDLDRQIDLVARGSAAQATLDNASRALLAQQKVVLALRNSLNLMPVQKASLDVTLATKQAEIEEAERALSNTKVVAALTGRVASKSVAKGQYVRIGDNLVTLEATGAAEVVAEFQPRVLSNMIRSVAGENILTLLDPQDVTETFDLLNRLDLQANVTINDNGGDYNWPAELVRFHGITDAETGAIGLVVRIDNPDMADPVNQRPPLNIGTFVQVRLSGSAPTEAIRIGRNALRRDPDLGDFVYVVDPNSRLARRAVAIGPILDDLVVITSGLAVGDAVVLSDPQPAVLGLLLNPVFH